jgi:membrane dipeptidase
MGTQTEPPSPTSLHERAIVIDGHSDLLVSISDGLVRLNQRLSLPDYHSWKPAGQTGGEAPASQPGVFPMSAHSEYYGPAGLYSLPQWLQGGVTVQVLAIYLDDKHLDRALQRGLEMAWWLHKEAEDNPAFKLVTQVNEIFRLKKEGKVGGVLSFEGFEPLGSELRFLDLYYKLGLRMASLTHNRRNLYADGPQYGVKTGGLTALGKQAIRRMNELGIVVDLVHMNETGFWEILELTQAPVVLSHTSAFSFCRNRDEFPPHPGFDLRYDRPKLEAIAKNRGVLGVIFFSQDSLEAIVANIETLLDIVGPDCIGIGSDFFGLEFSPPGLEDISQVPRLTERLLQKGHTEETILKILGGNFLRVFKEVWKE